MQSCDLMNGPLWEAPSTRMKKVSTDNLWQYTAHSNWPSSLLCQEGRGYHSVSHDSQSGSHGYQRAFHHNTGQNLSKWSTNVISCSQSDGMAHWQQTPPPWRLAAGVQGDNVITDALQHRTAFYQNMTETSPYPKNDMTSTLVSGGQSLSSTNVHQRLQQHSPVTPVVSNKMRYSAATCHSSFSSAEGRTQPAAPSLRRNKMDLDISQLSPQPHRPLPNSIPEIVQSQQSKNFSKTRTHLQCQIAHKPQTLEPFSPLNNNGNTSLVLQERPSSEECLQAAKECKNSGQGSVGLSSEVTWHQKDLRSSDILGQTDRKAPETLQKNIKQSERTLHHLPSKAWTTADLMALVMETQHAQTKSESSATFDINNLISSCWNNDIQMLNSQLKTPWYQNLMREISAFFFQHWTKDSVVLTQSKCNLDLRGFHVLQDGEKHLEPRYTSSWRNINEKLDDIDKEFGFAGTSVGDFLSSLPSNSVSAPPNTPKAVEEEREQEEEQKVEQEEDEQERTSSEAHGRKDDNCSFIIRVLPQEKAKAIYESFLPTGDHPAKENLKSSQTEPGDSSVDKDLSAESEVEMFFAQWKVVLGCSPAMKSHDDVSHTILEDEDLELDGTSSTDGGNSSINLNQSKDAAQEMGNVSQQRQDVTSKASHLKEMPTFQQRHWRMKQSSNISETFCLGAKGFATAKERKRTRHSAINIPLLKKLKTHKRRRAPRSTRRKDSVKDIQLVLFGSTRRRRNWTLPTPAPEVLNLSQRGVSAVKQRIYQEWSLPPTRIESRSKLRSQERTFTERSNREDRQDEQKRLQEMKFRKDNNKVSLKKWRPRPDGHGTREKARWSWCKDGGVKNTAEGQ